MSHRPIDALAACPSGRGTPIHGIHAIKLPCLGGSQEPVWVAGVHGNPEVINIWASWCGPCQREVPMLERAHQAVGSRVLFLGVDVRDTRSHALAFLGSHAATYPQVFDKTGRFPTALGYVGVPDTLVVDRAGHVVYRRFGGLSKAELNKGLARAGVHLTWPSRKPSGH